MFIWTFDGVIHAIEIGFVLILGVLIGAAFVIDWFSRNFIGKGK